MAGVRTRVPGCCRGADVWRGWSAGLCSHPRCWDQLARAAALGLWLRRPPRTRFGSAPRSRHGGREGQAGEENEGTSRGCPEPGSGSAGCPRARARSDPSPHAASPGTGRGRGPKGTSSRRAQRESWQGPEQTAALALETGDFSPNGRSENSCWWKEICRTWERGQGAG